MKKIHLFIENFLLILVTISLSSAQVSGPRKCANEKCSEPISIGRASITYSSPNDFNLSFKNKDKIVILSKAVTETSDEVWYVEINGKLGYAPKKFIVEEKIIVASSKLLTVENVTGTGTVTPPSPSEQVQSVQESPPDIQDAQIIQNSSEASNVNEVDKEDSAERVKRATPEQSLTEDNNTVDEVRDNLDSSTSEEVQIEDLNKYDSKNFDERSEDDEEDEEDDEYEDTDSPEEEIANDEPVIEEPFIKKPAYVTTDSSEASDEQPTLEILAPTQSEIELLKQERVTCKMLIFKMPQNKQKV